MSIEDCPRPRRNIKRIAFWSACLVASIAVWMWLLTSVHAAIFKDEKAQRIIVSGKIMAQSDLTKTLTT